MKDHVLPASEDHASLEWMPPRSPLAMPTQDFGQPFTDPNAPPSPVQRYIWIKRILIILPAALITIALATFFTSTLPAGGNLVAHIAWVALISVTFFWISFVLCMSAAGFIALNVRRKVRPEPTLTPSLDVAVLMPIYNEDVSEVFANVLAMQEDLRKTSNPHKFTVFILSDSQDPHVIAHEHRAFVYALATKHPGDQLFYRRRDHNKDFKTGNLRQWITNWGGNYDAMLVLDADSLMSANAVLRLTNTLAQNPSLGLIQGALRIFRGRRLLARWQQFAGLAFGALPATGLATWSGNEGNYFGHNAISRTRAFATCAGLPAMAKRGDRHIPILSHDFVEAALLRRAGWGIKIIPDLQESFEGTPETLIDFIRRDRRWCQGNMQHLRIMTSKGFHPISRFHMFHNALAYLMSPAWLLLILIWVGYGYNGANGEAGNGAGQSLGIFAVIYAMLLAPKIVSAITILASASKRQSFGGATALAKSFFAELAMSILIAPILMIHQTVGVLRSILSLPAQWGTPARQGVKHAPSSLLRFHAFETGLGLLLTAGLVSGLVSWWLLPIALSFALAPVLSNFSSVDQRADRAERSVLTTELDQHDPLILEMADRHRKTYRDLLASPLPDLVRAKAPSGYRTPMPIQKSA